MIDTLLTVITLLLSGLGLWISIYFTGVFYKWFLPNAAWVPRFCRLDGKSCLMVLETPRAKILGVPNSLLGIGVYGYLVAGSPFFPPLLGWVLLSFALIRSVYLFYSLLFVTKIPCVLCFTSHALNLTLFLIFTYRVFH